MNKFIMASFLLLGWAFYELSGGADFEPEARQSAEVAEVETTVLAAAEDVAEPEIQISTASVSALPAAVQDVPAEEAEVVEASLTQEDEGTVTLIVPELITDGAEPEFVSLVAPAASPAAAPETAPELDLRSVAGSRVNMRAGPGTNYGVVETLTRGTVTEVLSLSDNGWAQIKTYEGQIGWMSAEFLTKI